MMAQKYGNDKKTWPKNDPDIYTACFGEGSRGHLLGIRPEELGLGKRAATVSTGMSMTVMTTTSDLSSFKTQMEEMRSNINHIEEVQQSLQPLSNTSQYITRDELTSMLNERDKGRDARDMERDARLELKIKECSIDMKQFLKESTDLMTTNLSGQICRDIANAKFLLEQSLGSTITKSLNDFQLNKQKEKNAKLQRIIEASRETGHARETGTSHARETGTSHAREKGQARETGTKGGKGKGGK